MQPPKDGSYPCPNPECVPSHRMTCGTVSAIATDLTQSGKRRLFRCRPCATHCAETRETVFVALRTSEEKVMMALKMLLGRVDLAGICFVRGVTEATVWAWRRRAAQQAEAIPGTCCGLGLGPRCPSTRGGTSSSTSTRVRQTRQEQACPTARMDRQGSGSAWPPSFAGCWRPWWGYAPSTPPRKSWPPRRRVWRASWRSAALASRALSPPSSLRSTS